VEIQGMIMLTLIGGLCYVGFINPIFGEFFSKKKKKKKKKNKRKENTIVKSRD
jgi:hypothetical protein